jgi:hypothetical protein
MVRGEFILEHHCRKNVCYGGVCKFRFLMACFRGVAVMASMIILKQMAKNLFHVKADTIKWAGQWQ